MNRRLVAAIGGVMGLAALAAWAIAKPDKELEPRPAAERPTLALVTSLPLIFGESFGLDRTGSAALARLEQRYRVVPIGVADAASLKGKKLLLMAHPRAQPAEALVELDQWVRDGGRLLLLADPRLDWPSEMPLGDRLRPPPAFADTGLLKHWGLRLAEPPAGSTAGQLTSNGRCGVEEEATVARCRVGQGIVTILADADFINSDEPEADQLDLLIEELDRLDSR